MGAKVSSSDRIEPSQLDNIHKCSPSSSASPSEISDKFKTVRTTTDVLFLLIMIVFLIAFLGLLGYCIFYGDILRIINGYDNCGNVCGKKNSLHYEEESETFCSSLDQTNNRFLIIIRNDSKIKTKSCVTNCSEFEGYEIMNNHHAIYDTDTSFHPTVPSSSKTNTKLNNLNNIDFMKYANLTLQTGKIASRPFFNRCVPKSDEKAVDTIFSKSGLKNFFEEVSEDFNLCWREFLYLCLISLAFSIVIIIFFRFFVGFVVWIVLIGVATVCCTGSIFLWVLWKSGKDGKNVLPNVNISELDSRKTETYFALAIIASIITVAVILVIIVMRKRIQLVVQLFKESGKALTSMPLLLIEPLLTFICLGIVFFMWFYFSLWIESSGKLAQKAPHRYYYEKDALMKTTRWYNLFAMFWMFQFIIGCQHMIIAGAVSTWYFTRDKSKLESPITLSANNLLRYHLGSVAMGSFLIALVQFIRMILKAVEKYLKKQTGNSTCMQCVLKSCQCCLFCFEKVLKYISRNAYIETAMYGYTFCMASKQAFRLLSNNILRVATINSVGDFVLFLGKVLVVVATVLCGIELLKAKNEKIRLSKAKIVNSDNVEQHSCSDKEGLQHMWVPITLAGLFGYFVAHCFITVYEMTIDTIFLCFCEDCERNDGISKPYYMSRGLMEFVENSKKALNIHDSQQQTNRLQAWQQ